MQPAFSPHGSIFPDGSAPVFRACASAMQRPTLTNVRIRSTRDAQHIFYAVSRNLLPMTVRRLDAEERRAIVSGNVYVWEERGASSEATGLGIERWYVAGIVRAVSVRSSHLTTTFPTLQDGRNALESE